MNEDCPETSRTSHMTSELTDMKSMYVFHMYLVGHQQIV